MTAFKRPLKRLPGKHSLFWKLACLLIAFCLLMIWLSWSWGRYMEEQNAYLDKEARATLSGYAVSAEQAWNRGGAEGVDAWLQAMRARESTWIGVIGNDLQSLSNIPLTDRESQRLTFLRGLDWPVSRHAKGLPWLKIPFPVDPNVGSLVIELPQRFLPGRYQLFWRVVTNGVIPGLFTLLLCVGLYRLLIMPLNQLREQANAWALINCTRGCPMTPPVARMSWASWVGLLTICPNVCRALWCCSSNCCGTCPMNCAHR